MASAPVPQAIVFAMMVAAFVVGPFVVYPVFLMKALCFALFACAFNLLIGYVGLLSFGHAAFLGAAGYGAAHAAKVWGFPPELAILFGTAVAAGLGVAIGALAMLLRQCGREKAGDRVEAGWTALVCWRHSLNRRRECFRRQSIGHPRARSIQR